MAERISDKIPMLLNENNESTKRTTRSASLSIPGYSSFECDDAFVCHTGPLRGERSSHFAGPPINGLPPRSGKPHSKPFAIMPEVTVHHGAGNDHLLMSGPLGLCNNPDCTSCPAAYKVKKKSTYKSSLHLDTKLQNILYGDSEGWGKKLSTFINSYFPVMNPHTRIVQQWNKFFVISCLVAIFVDPLFFYLFSVEKDYKCIVLNWSLATGIAAVRSVTDFIYLLHMVLQQISTLAGNLVPSYFEWEVLFTLAIVGLGLLLFALLIGNMQNFLQALGRRRLEKQLRRRDIEQWMNHRQLPEKLKRQVRKAERFSWAATRGVNEEELLENLPEDLQRAIRRHFFKFLEKVRLFTLMDEPIIDAICEKLRQKFYIRGSDILYRGGPVEKMVFIVRGNVESIGADGNVSKLSEGDVCGEELLTWYLEHSSDHKDGAKIRFPGSRLFSTRTVTCMTNVEAFALRASDLEEVTVLFARFLRNPRVQGAIRYESPYWRNIAAVRIQVAWRYRQKRLKRNAARSVSHRSVP